MSKNKTCRSKSKCSMFLKPDCVLHISGLYLGGLPKKGKDTVISSNDMEYSNNGTYSMPQLLRRCLSFPNNGKSGSDGTI